MYEKSVLSECEMVTMRCVWNLGKNATAFNVINMLAEDYGLVYKETTVYTFLKKLKEKGFLDTFRRGVRRAKNCLIRNRREYVRR